MISDADSDRIDILEKQRNLSDSSPSCTPSISMEAANSLQSGPHFGKKGVKGKKWKRNRQKYNDSNSETARGDRNVTNGNLCNGKETWYPSKHGKQDNYYNNLDISVSHDMTYFRHGSDTDSGLGSAAKGSVYNSCHIRPDAQITTYVLEQGSSGNHTGPQTMQSNNQQLSCVGYGPSNPVNAVDNQSGPPMQNPFPVQNSSSSLEPQAFQPQYILQRDEEGLPIYLPIGPQSFPENSTTFEQENSPQHPLPLSQMQAYQQLQYPQLVNQGDISEGYSSPGNTFGMAEGYASHAYTEGHATVSTPYNATSISGYHHHLQSSISDPVHSMNTVVQQQVHDFTGYHVEGVYSQQATGSIHAASQSLQQSVHHVQYPGPTHQPILQPSLPHPQVLNTSHITQTMQGQYGQHNPSPQFVNYQNHNPIPNKPYPPSSLQTINSALPSAFSTLHQQRVNLVDINLDTGKTVYLDTCNRHAHHNNESTFSIHDQDAADNENYDNIEDPAVIMDHNSEKNPKPKHRSRRLKQGTHLMHATEKRTFVNPPPRACISINAEGKKNDSIPNPKRVSERKCNSDTIGADRNNKDSIPHPNRDSEQKCNWDYDDGNNVENESDTKGNDNDDSNNCDESDSDENQIENRDIDQESDSQEEGPRDEIEENNCNNVETRTLVYRKQRKVLKSKKENVPSGSMDPVKGSGLKYEVLLVIQALAILLLSLSLLYIFLK